MNEISCEIEKDLLPLFQENFLSEDSRKVVEAHLKSCRECIEFFEVLRGEISTDFKQKEIKKNMVGGTFLKDIAWQFKKKINRALMVCT